MPSAVTRPVRSSVGTCAGRSGNAGASATDCRWTSSSFGTEGQAYSYTDHKPLTHKINLQSEGVGQQYRSGDGRLSRIGKYLRRSGIASVLVNLGQDGGAISLDRFANSQGSRIAELSAFVRRNGLPCHQARGPHGGPHVRMTVTDPQAFHDRFMSFRSLGVRARLDWDTLRQRLEARRIVPAGG